MKTIRLPMLSADDTVAEIRRLYFSTTRETIQADLTRALDLLKSIASEEERERAAVFMEGMAEMRSEWRPPKRNGRGRRSKAKGRKGPQTRR